MVSHVATNPTYIRYKYVKNKQKPYKKRPTGTGALFLSNLPHGFFEEAIRSFFEQFGTVLRLRVARSEKSAKPMGWAYVEFENEEVAKIACETMDGYLMFNHLIKCSLIKSKDVNSKMFVRSDLGPEQCLATLQKLANQRQLEKPRGAPYVKKKKLQLSKAREFANQTLGIDINGGVNMKKKEHQPKEDEILFLESETEENIPKSNKKQKKNSTKGKKIKSLTEISEMEEVTRTPKQKRTALKSSQEKETIQPKEKNSPKKQKMTPKSPNQQKITSPKSQKSPKVLKQKAMTPAKIEESPQKMSKSMKRKLKQKQNSSSKPNTSFPKIEIDEVDEEIIVKTPPNVFKSIRKGRERVICDSEADTLERKSPVNLQKSTPLHSISQKLVFNDGSTNNSSPQSGKRRRSIARTTNEFIVTPKSASKGSKLRKLDTPTMKENLNDTMSPVKGNNNKSNKAQSLSSVKKAKKKGGVQSPTGSPKLSTSTKSKINVQKRTKTNSSLTPKPKPKRRSRELRAPKSV